MKILRTIIAALLVASIPTQALAADCTVTETITRPDGSPVVGLKVTFEAVLPQANGSTMLAKPVTAVTNASGQLSVVLLQGAVIRVTSYDLGLNGKNISIPASGTANLRTLVAAYISPTAPPSLDATQIKMGVSDSGLIAFSATDSVSSAIVQLNQTAGTGGGGGGAPTFAQVNTALGAANADVDFNGEDLVGINSITAEGSGALQLYSQGVFLRGAGNVAVGLLPGSNGNNLVLSSGGVFMWTATSATGTPDTGLERLAAGVAGATNGSGTLVPFRAATAVGNTDLVPKLQMDTALALKADASAMTTALAGKASTTHASTHSSAGSDAITHNNLAGLTTGDPHTQYVLDIERGAASGVATLDAGTKVPVAQLPAASTTAIGAVELATDGETASGVVVQGNDARLSNARTPTAHQSGHQSGGGDALSGNLDANGRVAVRVNSGGSPSTRRRVNIIAGTNVTVAQADDSVNEEVDVTISASGGGGGGLTDGDYGDVTVGGAGTTLTVDNNAISFAKMQDIATDTCVGRATAATGDPETFTCTAAGRAILDDADATAQRLTLGLGTAATQASTAFVASGASITLPNGAVATPSLNFTSGTTTGLSLVSGQLHFSVAGVSRGYFDANNFMPAGAIGVGAGNTYVQAPSSGVLKLSDNADADFGRLQFGGTTSAFPSLKRSGAGLVLRLADDSADTTLTVAAPTVGGHAANKTYVDAGDITDGDKGDVTVGSTHTTLTIDSGAVTSAKIADGTVTLADMANLAQDQVIGRVTASTGVPETFTVTATARTVLDDTTTAAMRTTLGAAGGTGTANGTNTGDQTITLTGDVTGSGTGSFAATIAADSVSNADLANMATATIKGRTTAGTGDPEDLTAAQATALLELATTTTKGLAPVLSNSATQYLDGTGNWSTPAGGGGGVTDGDRGDITVSGTGATWSIDAGAVTLADMADLAQDQFIGRVSASTGVPETATITAAARTVLDDTTTAAMLTSLGVTDLFELRSWKNPVRVATTANITLSGTQTIDGVAVIAGDRVLVKNQTTASQNGIYVVAAGAWTRATDMDVSAESPPGVAVRVQEGTAAGDTGWMMTTNAPITLGTTSLTFAQSIGSASSTTPAAVGTAAVGTSITWARSDHVHAHGNQAASGTLHAAATTATAGFESANDKIATDAAIAAIKQPARVVATGNVTQSAPQTIDGVSVIAGNRVLCVGQTTASQNGLWVVAAGAWTRATDMPVSGIVTTAGMHVAVSEGTANADSLWALTTDGTITVGTTAIAFSRIDDAVITASGGITRTGDNIALSNMAANTIKGNNTGGSAAPIDMTGTQATALLDTVTSGTKGLAPASGGGTTNFLRADGTWAAPSGGGGALWYKDYMADQMLSVGASWPTTAMADLETYNLVNVVAYDQTTSQGRGLEIVLPTGATTISLAVDGAAAASGFTSNNGLVFALDCRQQYGTGSFTQQTATAVTLTDNATIQRKTFDYTVAGLSATAGTVLLCEFERLPANASDTLTQDWRVAHIGVTVN